MAKILVLIVSDQTAPNALFIKEKIKEFDKCLFISTSEMESKGVTQKIIAAINLPQEKLYRSQPLIVDAFSFDDVERKLNEAVSSDDEFIVNITNGTKIMSLATFEFFKNKNTDSEIFYVQQGGNKYTKISPGKVRHYTFSQYLNLREYLVAYGVQVKNDDEINFTWFDQKAIEDFFAKAIKLRPEQIQVLSAMQKLSNSNSSFCEAFKKKARVSDKNKKWQFNILQTEDWASYKINENDKKEKEDLNHVLLLQKELLSFLQSIQFPFKEEGFLLPEERSFLTGGWLEEWTYYKMKEILDLNEDSIGINPKITKVADGKETEFDVVAINKEGNFYIMECKTSTKTSDGNKLRDILDKLAARTKDIGLSVKSYLVTLDKDIKAADKNAYEREYKITILDYEIITNLEVLRQKLIA